MSSLPSATAVLRKLQARFRLALDESRSFDPETGRELWRLTATSPSGQRWTVVCQDYEEAVTRMIVMVGTELMVG